MLRSSVNYPLIRKTDGWSTTAMFSIQFSAFACKISRVFITRPAKHEDEHEVLTLFERSSVEVVEVVKHDWWPLAEWLTGIYHLEVAPTSNTRLECWCKPNSSRQTTIHHEQGWHNCCSNFGRCSCRRSRIDSRLGGRVRQQHFRYICKDGASGA